MVFGIIPECRSDSFRNERSVSPESPIETAPGEEAQMDYGTGPIVRDSPTAKYWRTRL